MSEKPSRFLAKEVGWVLVELIQGQTLGGVWPNEKP